MGNVHTFDFPPFVTEAQKKAYIHFSNRVNERVETVGAPELFLAMQDAVAQRDPKFLTDAEITYAGRLDKRNGRRLWKLILPDSRVFWVVYDERIDCPITVVAESMGNRIRCGSRRQKHVIEGKLYVI